MEPGTQQGSNSLPLQLLTTNLESKVMVQFNLKMLWYAVVPDDW